ATLWRVHLLFWPMYLVFAIYAVSDRSRTVAARKSIIFVVLAAALAPVMMDALALYREAGAHAYAPPPGLRQFIGSLKWPLMVICGGIAAILTGALGWEPERKSLSASAWALIFGWWLCQPLCLFAISRYTAASVFVPRYL